MKNNIKFLVTGANGSLGSQIIAQLKKYKIQHVALGSRILDLTNYKSLDNFFKKNKPNYVIHAANKVYGIGGNANNEFEMLNENLIINSNLLKVSKKYKIEKIIFIGSSAVFSEKYKTNIKEKNIFKYKPHHSEYYYGLSKRMMLRQLVALKKNYKIKFCYIIMNNMYGTKDNFNIKTGHVIPSLIHKFYLAKKSGKNLVKLWGSPKTKRCFLYTKDAANIILNLYKKNIDLINVSGKKEISIGHLAKLIGNLFKYKGKIKWENKVLTGVNRRKLNLDLMKKLNLREHYTISDGLNETISWFKKNYQSKEIRK